MDVEEAKYGGGSRIEGRSPSSSAPKAPRNTDVEYNQQPEGRRFDCSDFIMSIFNPFSSPGKSGTYKAFLLLTIGILASIIGMFYPETIKVSNFDANCPAGYEHSCLISNVVLRFSFALVCVFMVQLIGTAIFTPFHDMAWLIKYMTFAGVCIGFFYASSDVFDTNGYAWFARIGGFLFLIFQQVILLDFAYTWNERWVTFAANDSEGWGRFYLHGLVFASLFLICGSISMIGVMFWQFGGSGCADTNVVISLTIILSFFVTIFQIFINEHYSLLTSAIMVAYATYICFAAVSLYPEPSCNPTLATGYQTLQQALGMCIITISLLWTTRTSISKLTAAIDESVSSGNIHASTETWAQYDRPGFKMILIEVTFVFVLISCYYAMILTNWSTLQSNNANIYNPHTGSSSFWLQAAAQWICMLLYMWTLVAPKLFPDRDFGQSSTA